MNSENNRPHPFPLPQEREQLLCTSLNSGSHSTNPALDSRKMRETILPLLGERAGVRAVNTN